MMRVIFSDHAEQRMRETRQGGIRFSDVRRVAHKIDNKIFVKETPIEGIAESGRPFKVVVWDKDIFKRKKTRIIVTVIGL